MIDENLKKDLETILPTGQISFLPDDLKTYGTDWTKYYEPNASAVVFPNSTEQIQKLVLWARSKKIALIPSGGRTGLSGAATAINREVIVSFDKMNRLIEFDPIDQTVTVEAGFVTEALQNFAAEKGLSFPVDFASRGSSQIGGNVATNAGGIKVVRYGLMRDWVMGLQVVTGTGEILNLNRGLVKNATGYDLRHLFIGSEGTLGFITQATLKLARPTKELTVFVLAVRELKNIMKVFHAFRAKVPLTAFEFFSEKALGHVLKAKNISRPFPTVCDYYALLEFENISENDLELASEIFENLVEDTTLADGSVSQNATQAKALWSLREDISESLTPLRPYKNDISVRVSKVPQFMDEVESLFSKNYPGFEIVWFGHIGDGNLHLNILKPVAMSYDEFLKKCRAVDPQLFQIIEKFEGSVSAEHGVGLVKKPFLHFTRPPNEIAILKSIKKIFDPDSIINPGKIF
jgi:FAD/FMN-containing dehydrogenase